MGLKDSKLFINKANTRSYFKVSAEGFPGSGKTHTLALITLGVWTAEAKKAPIVIVDTEQSSKFLVPLFTSHGAVEGETLFVTHSRSLADFGSILKDVEAEKGILFVDSITHLHDFMIEEYKKRKNRTRLEMMDHMYLKPFWKEHMSEPFVRAQCHILFTGRAAWTYDYEETGEERADGKPKKEFIRSGVKMRGDNELAYEPDMVLLMERHEELTKEGIDVSRKATVLKSRYAPLDGKVFYYRNTDPWNKAFLDFETAYRFLVTGEISDNDRVETSIGQMFGDMNRDWYERKKRKQEAIEELEAIFTSAFPGQAARDKKIKVDLLQVAFGTRSWTAVQDMRLEALLDGMRTVAHLAEYTLDNMESAPIQGNELVTWLQKERERFLEEEQARLEQEKEAHNNQIEIVQPAESQGDLL